MLRDSKAMQSAILFYTPVNVEMSNDLTSISINFALYFVYHQMF